MGSIFAKIKKKFQIGHQKTKFQCKSNPPMYHKQFHPNKEFENWATVEVHDFKNIPDGMKSFILKEGLYAVFQYKGLSSDSKVFEYVFLNGCQKSMFEIDDKTSF